MRCTKGILFKWRNILIVYMEGCWGRVATRRQTVYRTTKALREQHAANRYFFTRRCKQLQLHQERLLIGQRLVILYSIFILNNEDIVSKTVAL